MMRWLMWEDFGRLREAKVAYSEIPRTGHVEYVVQCWFLLYLLEFSRFIIIKCETKYNMHLCEKRLI